MSPSSYGKKLKSRWRPGAFTELTRQITPPTKNGHAPPPNKSLVAHILRKKLGLCNSRSVVCTSLTSHLFWILSTYQTPPPGEISYKASENEKILAVSPFTLDTKKLRWLQALWAAKKLMSVTRNRVILSVYTNFLHVVWCKCGRGIAETFPPTTRRAEFQPS